MANHGIPRCMRGSLCWWHVLQWSVEVSGDLICGEVGILGRRGGFDPDVVAGQRVGVEVPGRLTRIPFEGTGTFTFSRQ